VSATIGSTGGGEEALTAALPLFIPSSILSFLNPFSVVVHRSEALLHLHFDSGIILENSLDIRFV
jgi:hypothetical protein